MKEDVCTNLCVQKFFSTPWGRLQISQVFTDLLIEGNVLKQEKCDNLD